MEQADLEPMLEELSTQITALESALKPLATSLAQTSSQLPLLDRAKLNVLTTYAIESILFSYIGLNGQEAKQHPVFEELTRVKQYFAKIKAAEDRASGADQPTMKIDKGAAGRFIKHGLAGNEQYDREKAERQAAEKERAGAKAHHIAQRTTPNIHVSSSAMDVQGEQERAKEGYNRRKKRKSSKSDKAPKSGHEAFQALLKGPLPQGDQETKAKRRKKDKGKPEE